MEGKDAVPVENTEESFRLKFGDLLQDATATLFHRLNAKFQDGDAGQLHFGAQEKRFVALDAADAPEIERLPISESIRVETAATQPRATNDAIHPATYGPQIFCGIPAVLSAQERDRLEDCMSRGVNAD